MVDKINLPRSPPNRVRRQLRQEVNFGCPVKGCGIPYLTYHHFDPTWREKPHHNPNGIIALCPNHASKADGGAWTVNQLKQLKKHPYITLNKISDTFSYLRNDLVLMIGCLAYGFKEFININDENVLGIGRTPQHYSAINMLIRDADGKSILEMKENDWIVYTANVLDFECPPRGKSFRIRTKGNKTDLTVRFDDFPPNIFTEKMVAYGYESAHIDNLILKMGKPKKMHVLSVLGTIQTGGFIIKLTETEIKAESKTVHLNLRNHSFLSEQRVSLFSFNENGTVTLG
jgi:hypothetical protein